MTWFLGPVIHIDPSELHVNDVQSYDEIYASGPRRRDRYKWQIKSGNSAKAMGSTISRNLHRLRRAAVDPYFSKRNVLNFEPVIDAKVTRLCELMGTFYAKDIITKYSFADCCDLLDSEQHSDKWREIISVMKKTALINHYGRLPAYSQSEEAACHVTSALSMHSTSVTVFKRPLRDLSDRGGVNEIGTHAEKAL